MSSTVPTIDDVMTTFPFFIEVTASVDAARAMMEEHSIHHLPVKEDGELVGIVSTSDLRLAELGWRPSPDVDVPIVGQICHRDPVCVELHTRLDHAAEHLADGDRDAMLVMHQGKLAGIVTTADLCEELAHLIRQHYGPSGEPSDIA